MPHSPLKPFRGRHIPVSIRCTRLLVSIFLGLGAFLIANRQIQKSHWLLLTVPVHLTDIASLKIFTACMVQHRPTFAPSQLKNNVDLLIIINGDRSCTRAEAQAIKAAVAALKALLPFANRVEWTHKVLEHDVYDKNRNNSKWVGGPNELFYSTFSDTGDLYQLFTSQYKFVQQLETDVCPVRDGWLDAIVEETIKIADSNAVISGARVADPLLYSAKNKDCTPSATLVDYLRLHVNGNALYRIGPGLQILINETLARYKNWPFDLAFFLTARDINHLHVLRYTHLLHNRVAPVDPGNAFKYAFYDSQTFLVHFPSHLRKLTKLEAAISPLQVETPVTVVSVCVDRPMVLKNLHLSLFQNRVKNVMYVVHNPKETLQTVLSLRPSSFYVLDAPLAPIHGVCALPFDVLKALVAAGFSVFNLDANAVVSRHYNDYLLSLDKSAVYFASAAVQSYGHNYAGEPAPRYKFSSHLFFMPASNVSLNVLSSWKAAMSKNADLVLNSRANCSAIQKCSWNNAPVRLLAPDAFVNGPNLMKRWPSGAAVQTAFVYFDVADAELKDAQERIRFRLQHAGQWLVGNDGFCCPRILVSPEAAFEITDDATSVRSFVDLMLHISHSAAKSDIKCVVPPTVIDTRTGEKLSFDVIFDFSIVPGAVLYPSLDNAPRCSPSDVINVTKVGSDVGRWNPSVFGSDIQEAFQLLSPAVFNGVCVDDHYRSVAEAALHSLRGTIPNILSYKGLDLQQPMFLAGKWRVLDKRVRSVFPNFLTLMSPDVLPESMFLRFGLRAHYPRLGEDFFFDILDNLVCQRASQLVKPRPKTMLLSELYAGIFAFVPQRILEEERDLGIEYGGKSKPGRLMFALETVPNNGFSNIVVSIQTMAYLAAKTNSYASIMPFSIQHLQHKLRPWSDVLEIDVLFEEVPSLRPSLWALLRHPSLLVEFMDGNIMPINWEPVRKSGREIHDFEYWKSTALRLYSRQLFRTLQVPSSAASWEQLVLNGQAAEVGDSIPYLGLSESQIPVFERYLDRDLAFRPFRAFNFQSNEPEHVDFAAKWRTAFVPSQGVEAVKSKVLGVLGTNFSCFHARVADEFLALHQVRPHFLPKNAFSRFQALLGNSSSKSLVYVMSDVNAKPNDIFPNATGRIFTCHQFGCPPEGGSDVLWGLAESEICASALIFKGNIFSTYTLAICGKRNDQRCMDAFDKQLGDGRLLF